MNIHWDNFRKLCEHHHRWDDGWVCSKCGVRKADWVEANKGEINLINEWLKSLKTLGDIPHFLRGVPKVASIVKKLERKKANDTNKDTKDDTN